MQKYFVEFISFLKGLFYLGRADGSRPHYGTKQKGYPQSDSNTRNV